MLGWIFDGIQKSEEISLIVFDSKKSGMCGPWIPLELGVTQTYLLDSMSGLIRRKIVCSEMVKNTVFPHSFIF